MGLPFFLEGTWMITSSGLLMSPGHIFLFATKEWKINKVSFHKTYKECSWISKKEWPSFISSWLKAAWHWACGASGLSAPPPWTSRKQLVQHVLRSTKKVMKQKSESWSYVDEPVGGLSDDIVVVWHIFLEAVLDHESLNVLKPETHQLLFLLLH